MSEKNARVAVLLPCYNESKTIKKVVMDFKQALPEAEIYVYDNNSTDDTGRIAREAGAIVRKEPRQGKGNVVRSMFREIDADCYIMADGDDTYPAEAAPEIVRAVLQRRADMVIGDRLSSTYFTENKRPFHNTGNRLVRWLINALFKSEIRDIMTGYRGFGRMFVKNFPVLSNGFEIETEMTIHALDKNFIIESIPVQYRDRPEGSLSKLNTVKDGMRVLHMITRLFREYKPYIFFSAVAFLFEAAAIVFFLPVFIEYLETGLVPRFPTLIVSGMVAAVGVLLWMCGIILEVIVKKHRQLYEILLNRSTEAAREKEAGAEDR